MKMLSLPAWTIISPIVAILALLGTQMGFAGLYLIFVALALVASILAAVHHAEVVAHRVGEPFGTLLLAVAITIIEVGLIVSLMLAGGPETAALARDTVFAAVMIILNGIIGICLFAGSIKYNEQVFGLRGTGAGLITLTAICVLTLVLPNYTTSVVGPEFSVSQLLFVAIISLVLYGAYVMIQTVRHRDYFLPPGGEKDRDAHAEPPSKKTAWFSTLLLLACLFTVVTLAKVLSPTIEGIVESAGAPKSLVGVIIAGVVLLPEGLAAFRAAKKNRLQTSLNLAIGSALASIGLTIPAVTIVSIFAGFSLTLGIDMKSIVLLILSLFTVTISLATGRTNILHGVVLLVIFAVYLFTTVIP